MAIPHYRKAMLDHVEAAFYRASRDPGALTVEGRTLGPEVPDRPLSLRELRPLLLRRTTSFGTRDRALNHVVAAARAHPDPWALGLIWLLLPGLRYMATRLNHAGADPEEADAEIVAGVLDALDAVALGPERVASRICWHAHRFARRHLALDSPVALSLDRKDTAMEARSPSLSANPEEVLAVAVRARVLDRDDAELLASCRLERRSLDEMAPAFEVPRETLKKRRVRAEKRVVALLDDSSWGVVPLRGRMGARWQRALTRRGADRDSAVRYHSRPAARIGHGRSPHPGAGLWDSSSGSRVLTRVAA